MKTLSLSASAPPRVPNHATGRTVATLLAITVVASIASAILLAPTRLERLQMASENGDDNYVQKVIDDAMHQPAQPGEVRAVTEAASSFGDPNASIAILDRFISAHPDSLPARRRKLELLRQQHRFLEVAADDEQLFGQVHDVEALREAADIFGSAGRRADRDRLLEQLVGLGRASADQIDELAHRLTDAGRPSDALAVVMAALSARSQRELSAVLIADAAALSANTDTAVEMARTLGNTIASDGQIGLLHVLIQTYTERGRPELSLAAAGAVAPAIAARPDWALTIAQLEAQQGHFASARHRLEMLRSAGDLGAETRSFLLELDLSTGDLEGAVRLAASLQGEALRNGLPHLLVETIAARRPDLLSQLQPGAFADQAPASAAVVAFARGDRASAANLAGIALQAPSADDLGPAFDTVAAAFGLGPDVLARLIVAARGGGLTEDNVTLLLDLVSAPSGESARVVADLRAARDADPRITLAWALAASASGQSVDVVAWLREHEQKLTTSALLETMEAAQARQQWPLMQMAAAILATRHDLPDGWSQGEIALTVQAAQHLTPPMLKSALGILSDPAETDRARSRVVDLLAASADLARVVAAAPIEVDSSVVALLLSAPNHPEDGLSHLSVLAAIAPRAALPALRQRNESDPGRFAPVLAASLLRSGAPDDARAVLLAAVKGRTPIQQDAVLQEALARTPAKLARPILQLGAETGRADWRFAFEDWLQKAGQVDVLRAELLRRAMEPTTSVAERAALTSRLLDLGDRSAAIGLAKLSASGKSPASAEVEQLMYLWGPRAEPDAIGWTRNRALTAPARDFAGWLNRLAYLGDARSVVAAVEARADLLARDRDVVAAYDAALAATRSKPTIDLVAVGAKTISAPVAVALAQLEADRGKVEAAWTLAKHALALKEDAASLAVSARAALALHRSTDAAALFGRLLALGGQPVETYVDAGDAMTAARDPAAARIVLETALDHLARIPHPSFEKSRLRARALLLMHRYADAISILEVLSARAPADAGLKADLLQAKLDQRRADNSL